MNLLQCLVKRVKTNCNYCCSHQSGIVSGHTIYPLRMLDLTTLTNFPKLAGLQHTEAHQTVDYTQLCMNSHLVIHKQYKYTHLYAHT